jgi:hypothetical protein
MARSARTRKMVSSYFLLLLPLLLLLQASQANAFSGINNSVNTRLYHAYDGLECYDCHTIHNSADGAYVINGGAPYARLLSQPTATDVCIQCHIYPASSAFNAPAVMSIFGTLPGTLALPAGDFYWSMIYPERGHNPGKSLGVQSSIMPSDPVLTTSPGGNYSTEDWDCTSCHDPHNRFGADVAPWRQLRRKVNGIVHTGEETVAFGVETYGGDQGPTAAGFEPIKSNSRGDIRGGPNETSYVNTRADGNPIEGANLFQAEGDINKNVYRGGFSSFCATCHGDFHGGDGESRSADNGQTRVASTWVRHPTNVAMNEAGSKYGITTYTAAVTNAQGTSPNPVGYDWKYPLVQPDADFTVRRNLASAASPATALGEARIMCLTCHKAHATKYDNMTRWDANAHSFIANGQTDFAGKVSSGDNPAYGCGKCHQKGGTTAYVKAF